MLETIINTAKNLLELDPNKRSVLFSWVFCSIIIIYLYNNNSKLLSKLDSYEKSCQESIDKTRADCDEQLRINREKSQTQIMQFVEKSNIERDSIYNYYSKELRKIKSSINKNINTLHNINNENN